MSQNVGAVTLIATKLASGNVQMVFQNPSGGVKFMCVVPSADFTSLNTTVNGGSTGAKVTLSYSQDVNKGDYSNQWHHSGGN